MKHYFWPLVIGLTVLLAASGGYTMQRTSGTEFCVSCHEMERHRFELKYSSHAVDKDKKPIVCGQCHIPLGFGPRYLAVKSYLGVKDVLVHVFGDTADMDRRVMQLMARRFVLDENCRACHQDLLKNVKGQAISLEGKKAHEAWLGKDGNGRRSCAGCHFNMAHLPTFDRRYNYNAQFAAKLPVEGGPGER